MGTVEGHLKLCLQSPKKQQETMYLFKLCRLYVTEQCITTVSVEVNISIYCYSADTRIYL